jgi:FkbM family methyltransferase
MLPNFLVRPIQLAAEARKAKGISKIEKIKSFVTLLSLEMREAFRSNKKTQVEAHFFGNRIFAYSYKTLQYLIDEIFLRKDYNFNYKKDNPVIIDCGANIGMAVLFLKRKYPDSRIFAFEPNPVAFELLRKNVSVNNLENVSCYNVGVAGDEGELNLYVESENDEGSLVGSLLAERGGKDIFKVRVEKLSKYILEHRPELIKMDIEGGEVAVVEELAKTNALAIPQEIILEYHHKINGQKARLSGFLKTFENFGFDYNLITDYRNPNDYQDILIHFYK